MQITQKRENDQQRNIFDYVGRHIFSIRLSCNSEYHRCIHNITMITIPFFTCRRNFFFRFYDSVSHATYKHQRSTMNEFSQIFPVLAFRFNSVHMIVYRLWSLSSALILLLLTSFLDLSVMSTNFCYCHYRERCPGRQLRTPYTIVYGRIHAWYAPYTTVFRHSAWCRITVVYLQRCASTDTKCTLNPVMTLVDFPESF
jgi:hypothetical protein